MVEGRNLGVSEKKMGNSFFFLFVSIFNLESDSINYALVFVFNHIILFL